MRPDVYLVSETLRDSSKPPLAQEFRAKSAAYVDWGDSDDEDEPIRGPKDGTPGCEDSGDEVESII